MRFKQVGNKRDLIAVVIKNNDTVQINAGQPVVIQMDGDGVDVVLPSTAGALNLVLGLKYGVNLRNAAVGAYSEAIVFGFCNSLTLLRQTRASSTNVWATEAARSIGEMLTVDTVNNLFVTGGVSTFAVVSASTAAAAQTLTILTGPVILGQTLASYASSASSTADTRTAITASVNAFVRMM